MLVSIKKIKVLSWNGPAVARLNIVEYGGYYGLENRNYSYIARESKLRKLCSMFCKQQDSICLVVIIFSIYWNTTISTLYSLLIYKGARRFVTILASASTEWVSLIVLNVSTLLLSVISNGQIWLSNATWRCNVPSCRTYRFQLQRGYLQKIFSFP